MTWPTHEQKSTWFEEVGYIPTPAQLPVHTSDARFKLIGGGWRAGKSTPTAMEAFGAWHAWDLCYIVGEQYENTTAEFDLLSDYFHVLQEVTDSKIVQRRSRPPSGQSRCSLVLLGGKRVVTISAKQGYQALTRRGEAPDLILLTEMEGLGYDIWLAARGRVAEKRGRVIISGKFPDDTGWQAEMYKRWLGDNQDGGAAFCLPTWSNTTVFKGRDDPEIKALEATVPALQFARDYGGEPQKPPTLVFPEFSYSTHVLEWVEFEEHRPVELWVDPGYGESAYAVLAVYVVGDMVLVIDEVHLHGRTGEEIIEICEDRDWWSKVTGGVMDIAGRQHHAAKSQIEVWRESASVHLRSSMVTLESGRDRLKTFLKLDEQSGLPRLVFSPRCKQTCAEFGRYVWRHAPDERVSGEKPIDKYCDGIKALTYGLMDRFGPVDLRPLHMPYRPPRETVWRAAFQIHQGG